MMDSLRIVPESALVEPSFARRLNRSERSLLRSLVVSGDLGNSLALYEALASARANGKTTVVAECLDPRSAALAEGLGLRPLDHTARRGEFWAGGLASALHHTFALATEDERAAMRSTFSTQVERFLSGYVERFYRGDWAQAVVSRRLTVEQYVYTLESMHQYVRFTTRLLGRAVACSSTTSLRAHFARHLSGEVNHEILIERDLERLGRSVDYLRDLRYANAATRSFMVVQQSMVAFEEDPILFVACPLAAEGISAHMDAKFLDSLRACIATGTSEVTAKKATSFFASHIETDGGDDGHWAATLKVLESHVSDERKLGELLSILELAATAFTASFDANVNELAVFSRPL
jgi:hypothetical protein